MSDMGHSIADAARGFVGTPFAHKGRRPGVALDCVGVVLCAGWACGVKLPDVTDYGRLPDPALVVRHLEANCAHVDSAIPGDILVFAYRRGKAAHFAILDDCSLIVHAYESAGCVVHTPIGRWVGRLHSRWRMPWHL